MKLPPFALNCISLSTSEVGLHMSLVAILMESVTYNNTFQGIEIISWKVRTNDVYSRVAMH